MIWNLVWLKLGVPRFAIVARIYTHTHIRVWVCVYPPRGLAGWASIRVTSTDGATSIPYSRLLLTIFNKLFKQQISIFSIRLQLQQNIYGTWTQLIWEILFPPSVRKRIYLFNLLLMLNCFSSSELPCSNRIVKRHIPVRKQFVQGAETL